MSFIQFEALGADSQQQMPSLISKLNLEDLAKAGARGDEYEEEEGEDQFDASGTKISAAKTPSAESRLHQSHGRKPTMQRRSPRAGGAPSPHALPHNWRGVGGNAHHLNSPRVPPGARGGGGGATGGAEGTMVDTESVASSRRRGEVSAEPFTGKTTNQPYRKTLIEKPSNVRAILKRAVDSCILFSGLTDEGKEEIVDAFEKVEARKNELLIEEGEAGDFFYVLESGTCDALKMTWKPELNDSFPLRVKSYAGGTEGCFFGELALLYNEPRAATIRVTSDTAVVWAVDRLTFQKISVHFKVLKQKVYEDMLRKIPGLSLLTSTEIGALVDLVEEKTVGPDTVIVKSGVAYEEAYVVLSGKVSYTTAKEQGQYLPGDVVGARALTDRLPVVADFQLFTMKDQSATFMTLSRGKLEEVLGPLEKRERRTERPTSMAPKRENLNHRHHIAMKFEDLNMYLGGTSEVTSGSISGGGPNTPSTPSPAAAAAAAAGVSGSVIVGGGGARPTLLLGTSGLGGSFVGGGAATPTPSGSSSRQLQTHREIVLGTGTFGKVIICKHNPTGEMYALKRLNKAWIVENSLEQHVVDERNVMTLTDHPFILKLHSSFWDDKYIYLVLELCLGGELFSYLRKAGKFNEQQTRFYVGSIVQAFDHLHSKSIVYRDLKPENLMLDEKGYLKVVDFGLAKVVKGRTWTICGTPEYLAPEVVLSKGHNRSVDYWALGILTFELVTGNPPYVGDDNMQIYRQIVENKMVIPAFVTPHCRDLIKDFTKTSLLNRLGLRRPGLEAVRKHPWFEGFDWGALDRLKVPPPIVPRVRNKADISNFDEYQETERDFEEPEPSDWKPNFPFQVVDGKTVLLFERQASSRAF